MYNTHYWMHMLKLLGYQTDIDSHGIVRVDDPRFGGVITFCPDGLCVSYTANELDPCVQTLLAYWDLCKIKGVLS